MLEYIVVFKDSATQQQINDYANSIDSNGGRVGHRYDSVLKGFSATITNEQLNSFQGDDIISYIEPDGVVTTQ